MEKRKTVKELEECIQKLTEENNALKTKIDQKEKEIEFWIKRADEGGVIHFGGGGNDLCGVSSTALVLFASNRRKPTAEEYPRDEDDWGRCERTIRSIPHKEWLARLFTLTEFPGWKKWEDKIIIATSQRMIDVMKKQEEGTRKCAQ